MRQLTGILVILILLSKFNAAVHGSATITKKCTSVKSGIFYDGDRGSQIDSVNTFQDCLNLCENDKICYGWQYQSSTNSCWLQTSVGTEYTDASYTAGSCVGPAAKVVPCTEVLANTFYRGDSGAAIKNVTSTDACMKKCDADSTCLGWSYRSKDKTCWTQTSAYGKATNTQYIGGSCIKAQEPYPTVSLDTYRQQALEAHNTYRSKHSAPPLTLDSELNEIAQKYAEKLAASKTFAHSGNAFRGNYMGENLYMISGQSGPMYAKGLDPVASWYSEIDSYDWSKPGFGMNTGHFTQLIWKNTKSLGIGRALSKDNSSLYIVANYYPGGNMGGEYPANVIKLS